MLRRNTLPLLAVVALIGGAGACRRSFSEGDARGVVTQYLEKLPLAYRKADVQLVLPLVGPGEGRRLTGLIGVKADAGVALDAALLDVQFRGVRRVGDEFDVFTSERWRYLDRKLGTGAPASPESTDSYELRYRIGKNEGRWVVLETEFVSPPVVGRARPPAQLDARTLHGMIETRAPEGAAGKAAPPARSTSGAPGHAPPAPAASGRASAPAVK